MADVRLKHTRARSVALIILVLILLLGLPLAVWLDLRNITDTALRRQASDLNSVIMSVRGFYASDVVGRILAAPPGTSTQVTHNYQSIPGAIPIPATLSLELGRIISEQQHNIAYRFVSDYPFKNRAPHVLDDFERNALATLRTDPHQIVTDVSNSVVNDSIRLIAPVIMESASSSATTATPKARNTTGRSATCAASRR
jgi:hypothetical protein